jgi:hypothetical protein
MRMLMRVLFNGRRIPFNDTKQVRKPYNRCPIQHTLCAHSPASLQCSLITSTPLPPFITHSNYPEMASSALALNSAAATSRPLRLRAPGQQQRLAASPRRLVVPRAAAVEAAASAAPAATYSGKGVSGPAQGRHFLHLDDFSKADLLDMLDRAAEAKERLKLKDATFKPFKDMSMAMIFTKPSARTRVSFETVRGVGVCRRVQEQGDHSARCWASRWWWRSRRGNRIETSGGRWRSMPGQFSRGPNPTRLAQPLLEPRVWAGPSGDSGGCWCCDWAARGGGSRKGRCGVVGLQCPADVSAVAPFPDAATVLRAHTPTTGLLPAGRPRGLPGPQHHSDWQARADQGHCARAERLQRRHHGAPLCARGPAGARRVLQREWKWRLGVASV